MEDVDVMLGGMIKAFAIMAIAARTGIRSLAIALPGWSEVV
jgi:hypothetical protein